MDILCIIPSTYMFYYNNFYHTMMQKKKDFTIFWLYNKTLEKLQIK